ncbi:unnamed protein product [Heterobilharzia americana]|nr:unnamed protein product [Heterobilharzia americana]
MFLKNSIFNQFHKKETSLHGKGFTEPMQLDSRRPSTLLWSGLDDSSASSTCDLDDDDYFGSERFSAPEDVHILASPKTSWIDNKWKKNLKSESSNAKNGAAQLSSMSPKISNIRKSSIDTRSNKSPTTADGLIKPGHFTDR